MSNKKTWVVAGLLAGAALLPLRLPSAWAQGGPPGGMGGPGGGMAAMRRNPKMRLGMLLRGVGQLEAGGKAPMSKAQAARIAALVRPWTKKPRMTEDQAKALFKQMNTVLTARQKNELDKMAAMQRRTGGDGGGGMGGGGGGRMGGGRGPGMGMGGGFGGGGPNPQQMREMRARMGKMQDFFKTYNPFYPPASYKELKDMPERMKSGMTRRYQSTMSLVGKLAKKARA